MPRSGFAYASELEWRMAARWAGYKYADEFCYLDGEEQSAIVAAYRTENQISGVMAQEIRRPKPKSKGRRKR